MKLITLNTWAGRIKEPFDAFLKEQSKDTDIFCFQEIFNNFEGGDTEDYIPEDDGNKFLLQEISAILKDFDAYFCPVAEEVYGIAIFLRKGIEMINSGEVLLYHNAQYDSKKKDTSGDHDRKMQWMYIKKDRKDLMIMNVHGHWQKDSSGDTPHTIEQSNIINNYIDSTGSVPKILVGDFNLSPNTQSIKMLDKYFSNLVTKHGVDSTRTDLYEGENRHADYVFISPEVLVEGFKVLPDVVSDHSPLLLQFDVF